MSSWSTQQLAEFLAVVSSAADEPLAVRSALERAGEALEAEIGLVVREGTIVAAVGFGLGVEPDRKLLQLPEGPSHRLDLDGFGPCQALATAIEDSPPGRLIVARAGDDAFKPDEVNVLRGMSRVLTLTLRMLRTLEAERAVRHRSEEQARENAALARSLQQRQNLLETLLGIQRLISIRAPIQEVLDAIAAGAGALLGAEIVGLRLIDPNQPRVMMLVSSQGLAPEVASSITREPIGAGASGRAIAENRLVVIEDYARESLAIDPLVVDGVRAAMAAPVHENREVVGSLGVATRENDRVYDKTEREMLLAFAQQASLALTDAQAVDAMHYAFHDSLTGLPNRALFLDRLGHALVRAQREGSAVAMLFIDLDGFKMVNDSLGHPVGDEVLVLVAERLEECVRGSDSVARFGGDEFAILIEDAGDKMAAEKLAERVLEQLGDPLTLGERNVFLSASIGIALSVWPHEGPSEMLRNADVAMYQAKSAGRGRYTVFEPGMHRRVVERVELESDLRRAVDEGELFVHYQPIVQLDCARLVGFEALLRWTHRERGPIGPATFVPLAEETGLIVPIGRLVLDSACRDARRWQDEAQLDCPLAVSVNLSTKQLQHSTLVPDVGRALLESRLDGTCLILEITETALMRDSEVAIEKLSALKDLGVRLAVDDFGSGYSSLSYLQRFPVDILKIDKAFVDAIQGGGGGEALARAIVALGETLRLETIAEGIETEVQLRGLRELRCSFGQGYYFSPPVSADAALEYIRRQGLGKVRSAEAAA